MAITEKLFLTFVSSIIFDITLRITLTDSHIDMDKRTFIKTGLLSLIGLSPFVKAESKHSSNELYPIKNRFPSKINISITNRYISNINILNENQLLAPSQKIDLKNKGSFIIDVPGSSSIGFYDLADKDLGYFKGDKYLLIRMNNQEYLFAYAEPASLDLEINHIGQVQIIEEKNGVGQVIKLDEFIK